MRITHHQVRAGESVGSIAELHGVPRHVVVAANPQKGAVFLGDCGCCCFDKPLEEDDFLTIPLLTPFAAPRVAAMPALDAMAAVGGQLAGLEGPGQDPVTAASRWVAACQAGTSGTGGQQYACMSLQYGAVAPFQVPGLGTCALFILDNVNVGTFEQAWGLSVLKTISTWSPNHVFAVVAFAAAAQAAKARGVPVQGASQSVETTTQIQTGTTPGTSQQGLTQSTPGAPPKIACGHGYVRNAQGKCVPIPGTKPADPRRRGASAKPGKIGGYGSVIDLVPGARLPTAGSARAIMAYGAPGGLPGSCPPPIGMGPSPCLSRSMEGGWNRAGTGCLLTDCK